MARLKFHRGFDSGQQQFDNVECNHYRTFHSTWGYIDVTVYPGFTDKGGICYRVSNVHRDGYPTCFIESESTGKTIETLRATDVDQAAA